MAETTQRTMQWQGIDLTPFTDPNITKYAILSPWRSPDGRGFVTDGRMLVEFTVGDCFDPPGGRVPNCGTVGHCQRCKEGRTSGVWWTGLAASDGRGINIDGATYDRRYWWLLAKLPIAAYRVNDSYHGCLDVIFEGGLARLMPMRDE